MTPQQIDQAWAALVLRANKLAAQATKEELLDFYKAYAKWTVAYAGNTVGNDLTPWTTVLTLQQSSLPALETKYSKSWIGWTLLAGGLGLVGYGWWRRKRRNG
jgi:hypothetical protein